MHENLRRVYYPDHDQRYPDLSPEQRCEYPDEIVDEDTGRTIAIRKHTMKEIEVMQETPWKFHELSSNVHGAVGSFGSTIFANDIPMSQVLERAKDVRAFMKRANRPMTDEEFERKRRAIEWYEKNIWNRVSK